MNVYAFYGRVSTEDQAERGTIENQIEFTDTLPLEYRPEAWAARICFNAVN